MKLYYPDPELRAVEVERQQFILKVCYQFPAGRVRLANRLIPAQTFSFLIVIFSVFINYLIPSFRISKYIYINIFFYYYLIPSLRISRCLYFFLLFTNFIEICLLHPETCRNTSFPEGLQTNLFLTHFSSRQIKTTKTTNKTK